MQGCEKVVGDPVSPEVWEKYSPLYEQVGKSAEVGFFPGENGVTRFVIVADIPKVDICGCHSLAQRVTGLAEKFRIRLDVVEIQGKLVISSAGTIPNNQQVLDNFFRRMKNLLGVDDLRLSGDVQRYC